MNTTPTTPPPRSLGDGIHLIPAPLPFKSPPWVNVYAIESEGGLLLIDCGTDWDPGYRAIVDGLGNLGLTGAQVHTLIVSHLHPDHVGMSARLVTEWGCRFVMHEKAAAGIARYNDTPGYAARLRRIASAHGVPEELTTAATNLHRPDYMPVISAPDHLVTDGGTIGLGQGRHLEVIHTPGHEQSHICLRDSRSGVFFSGDHVLPRISPVVMYDEGLTDPLGDYMASLQRVIDLDVGLTYPAHGTLMDRGDERAHQILLHHIRRLGDMAEMIRSDDFTAWEVMRRSFRPNLDAVQSRLAFLETLSHLENLRLNGRIGLTVRDGTTIYHR